MGSFRTRSIWYGFPDVCVLNEAHTRTQTKWLAMLLNKGVDPHTNRTVVPRLTFDEMTTAHSLMFGQPVDSSQSIMGYGMGWSRVSYAGHDVRRSLCGDLFASYLTWYATCR